LQGVLMLDASSAKLVRASFPPFCLIFRSRDSETAFSEFKSLKSWKKRVFGKAGNWRSAVLAE
jgi:hypothetical protein